MAMHTDPDARLDDLLDRAANGVKYRDRKYYATMAKRQERRYRDDIIKGGFLGVVEARASSAHTTGRWAVYFVWAPLCNRVKIGATRGVMKRFAALSGCAPERFVHLGWIPGGFAIERGLHAKLSASRRHGEWFELTEEVKHELARFGIVAEIDPLS